MSGSDEDGRSQLLTRMSGADGDGEISAAEGVQERYLLRPARRPREEQGALIQALDVSS